MLHENILNKVFGKKANYSPSAFNDNNVGQELVFFTSSQFAQLEALAKPYINAGLITKMEYGKGFESGFFLLKDERLGSRHAILCVSIRKKQTDTVPIYALNGVDIKPDETINFKDIMILAKNGITSVLSAPPRPEARLSIV